MNGLSMFFDFTSNIVEQHRNDGAPSHHRLPRSASPFGRRAAVVMIAPLLSSPSRAAEGSESHAAGHASGTVNFPVSCSGEAQAQFNESVALLHHMTYPQAREAFERVRDHRSADARWRIGASR